MGDRANIYLIDSDDPARGIYLYTHWGGSELPEALRKALAFGQGRWHDPQYLARIIASRVFMGMEDSLTGAGISTYIGDNEYPIIVANLHLQQVSFAMEGSEAHPDHWRNTMPFEEYVARDPASYPKAGDWVLRRVTAMVETT